MFECPVNHPALLGLFDPALPNNPALWAVLRGRNTGTALVDDPQNPTQCLLRTDAVLTYASRQISQAFLDEAIRRFRGVGKLWLLWPDWLSSQLHPPEPVNVRPRFEFYDCDPHSAILNNLRWRLPAGFDIRSMDRQLLERCEWREEMEFYCGSLDNFLVNGVGLCMMQADEIIVEAYASPLGEAYAETGAITREAYRGLGYAPIACAYLFEVLERRGYKAYWSCDADNVASIRVTQKLGFREKKAYQILEYSTRS